MIAGTTRVLSEALRARGEHDVFLIAEDERGERAGFVYAVTERDFFTREPYLHVSEIAAARSGAGAGRALMAAAENWAREHGYRFVTLNVVEQNALAQRFYERLGYGLGHRHYVKRIVFPADEGERSSVARLDGMRYGASHTARSAAVHVSASRGVCNDSRVSTFCSGSRRFRP